MDMLDPHHLINGGLCADRILFCTHNEDERGECRRLRVIPPLNDDCDIPDAPEECVEFHCVIAEVRSVSSMSALLFMD